MQPRAPLAVVTLWFGAGAAAPVVIGILRFPGVGIVAQLRPAKLGSKRRED